MSKMLGEACHEAGIPALNIPTVLFLEGMRDEWGNDSALIPLVEDGYLYFGFRFLPRILLAPEVRLRDRQSVLLVRDPRDALVSQYFSFSKSAMSHQAPKKNRAGFMAALHDDELDIDAYVLQYAQVFLDKIVAYQENLDFDRVLVQRYEDV